MDQESSCINNSTIYCTCTKGYQRANLLWGAGSIRGECKELYDLQNEEKKKQAVVFGQDNGRLPGPTGRVLVPNYPVCLFPFSSRFPLFLAVKWMDALKFPPVPSPRREIQTLRPTNQAGRGYSLHAHPSPDHIRPFRNTHKRTSRPPTFKIAPTELRGLGGNNNRADEGPKVPCGLKKKKKKKATMGFAGRGGKKKGADGGPNIPYDSKKKKKKKKRRPSSRPVDYCLGKPEISGAPEPPLSFRVTAAHTHPEAPAAAYRDIFRRKKNTTYLFQIVHSGIFSLSTFFPLSRSTVRPAPAPLWPLLWMSPGGAGLRNAEVQPQHICHHRRDVSERAGQRNVSKWSGSIKG